MRELLPDIWYIDTTEVPEAGSWFNSQLDKCTAYSGTNFKHISSHNNIGIRIGAARKTHHSFSGIRKGAEKITREEFLHFVLNKSTDSEPLFLN